MDDDRQVSAYVVCTVDDIYLLVLEYHSLSKVTPLVLPWERHGITDWRNQTATMEAGRGAHKVVKEMIASRNELGLGIDEVERMQPACEVAQCFQT